MPFLIRNLMISVLPKDFDPSIFGECDAGSEIPPGAPPPPPPPPPPGPDSGIFGSFSELELRALLQIALAQLGGPLSQEELRPRSLKELKSLEDQLHEALQQVRKMREEFRE
jgi:hypothetical protein